MTAGWRSVGSGGGPATSSVWQGIFSWLASPIYFIVDWALEPVRVVGKLLSSRPSDLTFASPRSQVEQAVRQAAAELLQHDDLPNPISLHIQLPNRPEFTSYTGPLRAPADDPSNNEMLRERLGRAARIAASEVFREDNQFRQILLSVDPRPVAGNRVVAEFGGATARTASIQDLLIELTYVDTGRPARIISFADRDDIRVGTKVSDLDVKVDERLAATIGVGELHCTIVADASGLAVRNGDEQSGATSVDGRLLNRSECVSWEVGTDLVLCPDPADSTRPRDDESFRGATIKLRSVTLGGVTSGGSSRVGRSGRGRMA